MALATTNAEQTALDALYADVRACTLCAKHLPLGPRPIVRGTASARLLIVSQAPGTRVHMTGLSFNDRSGDRLREWLGIGRKTLFLAEFDHFLAVGDFLPHRFLGAQGFARLIDIASLFRREAPYAARHIVSMFGRPAMPYHRRRGASP